MKHHIITSSDGSHTLKLEDYDECYHSTNGAFAEASHIYIHSGIEYILNNLNDTKAITVVDIGIGTALNCISTLLWQQALVRLKLNYPQIHYIGIEKYPISVEEAALLNFPEHISLMQDLLYSNLRRVDPDNKSKILFDKEEIERLFDKIHSVGWENEIQIVPGFTLTKQKKDIVECDCTAFNSKLYPGAPTVVYYDTFSPSTQPALWDISIFNQIFKGINNSSILVTYCSKGIVKQALRDVGFKLERIAGPPGKRHILRATKI